jgi:hypothetical protein
MRREFLARDSWMSRDRNGPLSSSFRVLGGHQMNPDIDWHRHRAASKRRVRVRFEAHLFVPGFLSVGNYNTTLSYDSLETGTGSSNSLCSTIQSFSFRTSRRIARDPRVCVRFAIMHGPRERPRWFESAKSSKSYPGAIWLGPWIIAVNSPAHGTRRTNPASDDRRPKPPATS